ncbi:hypothetical protein AGMMS49983_20660 [Clostridia bacterium]|nr:hypothetical protein AGMMS49983_20660 [Clostridia bacterium]
MAIFQNAALYRDNFENYIGSKEDVEKYRNQPLEIDANNYAVDRIGAYYMTMLNFDTEGNLICVQCR